jgi:hypothetical protein
MAEGRQRSKEMNSGMGLDEHDKVKDRASVDAGEHTRVAKNPQKDAQETSGKVAAATESDHANAQRNDMPKSKDKNAHKDKDKAKGKQQRLAHAVDADTKAD